MSFIAARSTTPATSAAAAIADLVTELELDQEHATTGEIDCGGDGRRA